MSEQSTGTAMELFQAVGDGGQISGLDQRLLDLVAKTPNTTPEELSEALGVPSMTPARCAARVREIIKSRDWLSQTEKKSLLLDDLIRLRDIVFERLEGTEVKFDRHGDAIEVESSSAWANTMVRLLREWRQVIESMQHDVESADIKIRRAHAEIMLAAIEVMFERMLLRLEAALEVKIPRDLANSIMEEVMPIGFTSLDSRTTAA